MQVVRLNNDSFSSIVHEIILNSGKYLNEKYGLTHWKNGYPIEMIKEDIKKKEVYLFKKDGIFIGTIMVSYNNPFFDEDKNAMYFSKFAIDPKYMKNGYGKKIIDYLKIYAKKQKKDFLRCDCYDKSESSLLFYYRNGFYLSHKEKTKYFQVECLEYKIRPRVMIVGAGILQSFLIKKSKELGYYTIAVDRDPSAIGFKYADCYKVIDIVNQEACYEYAKEQCIDAVLTGATDYSVLTVSYIAQKLGLNGIDYNVAKIIKNKYSVHEILFKKKIIDKRSYQIGNIKEIEDIKKNIKFPVIIKPCDGSGSRGVNKVNTHDTLEVMVEKAIKNSLSKKCIIEPFIPGQEYGIESFVYKGMIYNLIVMKKIMTKEPYYAELGHSNSLDEKMNKKIIDKVNSIINALNINFGAINMDLIVNDDEIYMVDIGARMGGNLIGSHIIPLSKGIDYMKMIIDGALNEPINCEEKFNNPLFSRLITLETGKIEKIDYDKLMDINCTYKLILPKVNDIVHSYRNNLDGCGYIICTGTYAEVDSFNGLKKIQNAITIKEDY